jgi:SAM-dependent methyltransferase
VIEAPKENWGSGSVYDQWMGRWSRRIAREFIDWLAVPPGRTWSDVGCGTGALVEGILGADPAGVRGLDRSEAYVSEARKRVGDPRVRFEVGDACALSWAPATCDVTVSGLVLNFVPDSGAMAREMVRVTQSGGTVAAYVWDYAGGMQMVRHFWDVAVELNRGDSKVDQAERFPLCQPGPLEALFRRSGLTSARYARSRSRPSFGTSRTTGGRSWVSRVPRRPTSRPCPARPGTGSETP